MAIVIQGGKKAEGTLESEGWKGGRLRRRAGTGRREGAGTRFRCPELTDVDAMLSLLEKNGKKIEKARHSITITGTSHKDQTQIGWPAEKIRASILFMGALIGRHGQVEIDMPGGCSIGSRPIDIHLSALKQMGMTWQEKENVLICEAKNGIQGCRIDLSYPSVGATENILLAAVLAKGDTKICGAAKEPEIQHLADFLNAMGAKITGAGTSEIAIRGVKHLKGTRWQLCSDRIVLLTYGMLTAGCGGEVSLRSELDFSTAERDVLEKMGCSIYKKKNELVIRQPYMAKAVPFLATDPYPEFPTDGQSLVMAALTRTTGISTIEERVFENRFGVIRELKKMGAAIDVAGNRARVSGVTRLHGARVHAFDLRGGAGLIIAGAMAEGTSEVYGEEYVARGYQKITKQLRKLGIQAHSKK